MAVATQETAIRTGRVTRTLIYLVLLLFALFYFMLGALLARILGLIIEGIHPRQWMLVAVETGVMTLAALWLWRSSAVS